MKYTEPELTYLVLDYQKEEESRLCLGSIHKHTKFPYKIIYLHNGKDAEYPHKFLQEGLIDQLIQTKTNNGLGIGTRDLFAASFSPYSFYLQNDQYLTRDFTLEEFEKIKTIIGTQYLSPEDGSAHTAMSVDLAGGVCGLHTYSERGHIIQTDFYKKLEAEVGLQFHGAGPYHDGEWREGQLQRFYKAHKLLHLTYTDWFVKDNGYRAIRENPDGSLWEHKADTRQLRLLKGPVQSKNIYPNFTDAEWDEVLQSQSWPEWKIPEKDIPYSYKEY